jgi:hypothetical protein
MMHLLKRPHPFIFNAGSVLIPGLLAFLLILGFAPFSFKALDLAPRAVLSLAFGLIASLGVLLVVGLLKWLAPRFMQEERWTVGKELFLIVTVVAGICLLNFGFIIGLDLSQSPARNVFQSVVLYTLGISILPIGILTLLEQFVHQRKKLKQAKRLTMRLRQQSTERPSAAGRPRSAHPIPLEAENGKVELQLRPDEILFLNSDGNYVDVHYFDGRHRPQNTLIRNRLKHFVSVLPEDRFFRCHKSYVVNGAHILRVEGNARNLELLLRGTEHRIPVSRSKSDALSAFLKDG